MGRQLTVSRRGEGAPIDAMLWLLEPDVRLVDSRTFTSLGEFVAWLRDAADVSVSWTEELKADAGLSIAVAEVLGTASGDPTLPTVDATQGGSLFPAGYRESGRGEGNVLAPPTTTPVGLTLGRGRPRGRRHRR
jgi:hypothetical protein